jgi:hypothetical protein
VSCICPYEKIYGHSEDARIPVQFPIV